MLDTPWETLLNPMRRPPVVLVVRNQSSSAKVEVALTGDFVDTADSYSAWVPGNSGGESETIIGEWLASRKPEGVVVATKVSQHPDFRGLAGANVRAAAEAVGIGFTELTHTAAVDGQPVR